VCTALSQVFDDAKGMIENGGIVRESHAMEIAVLAIESPDTEKISRQLRLQGQHIGVMGVANRSSLSCVPTKRSGELAGPHSKSFATTKKTYFCCSAGLSAGFGGLVWFCCGLGGVLGF